ncbi:MAG: hypothetical protein U5Q03_17435 [Bacteroidota bacterium]|nr:hypothetical protein [Bacteroidota bacterium]
MSKLQEQIAEIDVNNLKLIDDIEIVKTQIDRFSRSADRLFGEKIIIYNEKTINYYGKTRSQMHLNI